MTATLNIPEIQRVDRLPELLSSLFKLAKGNLLLCTPKGFTIVPYKVEQKGRVSLVISDSSVKFLVQREHAIWYCAFDELTPEILDCFRKWSASIYRIPRTGVKRTDGTLVLQYSRGEITTKVPIVIKQVEVHYCNRTSVFGQFANGDYGLFYNVQENAKLPYGWKTLEVRDMFNTAPINLMSNITYHNTVWEKRLSYKDIIMDCGLKDFSLLQKVENIQKPEKIRNTILREVTTPQGVMLVSAREQRNGLVRKCKVFVC